ncbi:hypothetical protein [Myroides marinus]|uniref:hypothetical protein n=1 Tax=Myroides marinus TaxID=703342 RepID=UPI000B0130F0|nr:hypothetical protein [Myroides marinus]
MSYSLSGIAIGKNYKNSFDLLQKQANMELELIKEISFEEASAGNTDEGYCDICYTDKGTLLFIAQDKCDKALKVKETKVLTFTLSESMKTYKMMYCEGDVEKRTLMTSGGRILVDEGEKLAIEGDISDVSELIWKKIGDILGEDIEELEEHVSCYRYKLKSKAVDKSAIRQAVIKGKNEYCHLIIEPSEKLVFTHDGNITHKKAIVLGKEDGFYKWIQFIAVLMLGIAVLTYLYVSVYYALIPIVIMLYLIYSSYTNKDLSNVNAIDKKDIIEVELVKRSYSNTVGFDIRFKDSEGKRKVRRFTLPNQSANQLEFYEKAKEIFKHNGYMK